MTKAERKTKQNKRSPSIAAAHQIAKTEHRSKSAKKGRDGEVSAELPVALQSKRTRSSGLTSAAKLRKASEMRTRQTRSRKAATKPDVKASFNRLIAQWDFLREDEKQERIEFLHDKNGMSYDDIAAGIGRSSTRIRQIKASKAGTASAAHQKSGNSKDSTKQAGSGQQRGLVTQIREHREDEKDVDLEPQAPVDELGRLVEILTEFFSGRHGFPSLSRQQISEILLRVDLSFSNQLYDRPKAFEIPTNADSDEVIRNTEPESGNPVTWLISIRASLRANPLLWQKAAGRALESLRTE